MEALGRSWTHSESVFSSGKYSKILRNLGHPAVGEFNDSRSCHILRTGRPVVTVLREEAWGLTDTHREGTKRVWLNDQGAESGSTSRGNRKSLLLSLTLWLEPGIL